MDKQSQPANSAENSVDAPERSATGKTGELAEQKPEEFHRLSGMDQINKNYLKNKQNPTYTQPESPKKPASAASTFPNMYYSERAHGVSKRGTKLQDEPFREPSPENREAGAEDKPSLTHH